MRHRIAVIPGDGIGKEVLPEGMRVLDAAGRRFGFDFEWKHFDWSCETYAKTGRMMPEDGIEQLRPFESIFLGAVGFPGVPDHVSLWGLLIPIRREFHQYINLRPVRLLKGVKSPLAGRGPADIDMLVVRENNEGEYSEIGGRLFRGSPEEMAIQQAIFTRKGCDRVMRYAFERAKARPEAARDLGDQVQRHHPHHAVLGRALRRHRPPTTPTSRPTSSTSTSSPRTSSSTPTGSTSSSARTSSATSCRIWAPPSPARSASRRAATSTPRRSTRRCSSPCTARPPTSPGKGIANPIGQIWSGAMMLEHLGHPDAAQAVVSAIERVVEDGKTVTRDLGGKASTVEVGKLVESMI